MDWEPSTITFYEDGKAIASAQTPASMQKPMYMLLNLAVGGNGSWPGAPASSSEFPASMQINWVHAYATANTVYVSGSSSISAANSASAIAAANTAESNNATPTAAAATTTTTTPAASTAPVTIGSGSDTLVLNIAEDAYKGDAQYTVSVDGTQIGGTQTAGAQQSAGATQTVNVLGNFAAGNHTVSVDFLNDLYAGTPQTDRNLYVDGATLNGSAVSGSNLTLLSAGTQNFTFTKAAAASAPAATPAAGSLGSGSDSFTMGISEDAWQGDAQYTVDVDGQQVGGVQTATTSHSAGAIQSVTVNGNWGSGSHTLGVTFINDLYGGTPTTDRNLYVSNVAYDGNAATPASASILWDSTDSFTATAPAAKGQVTLLMSEDSYQGDAQYSISVDGKTVGTTGAITASHGAGQTQAVNIPGVLSAGTHDIGVSFLNDLYAGTAQTDRNLYVNGVQVNGSTVPGASLSLYSQGTQHLSVVVPTN